MKTILALLLLSTSALAADFTITFTVPDAKAGAVIADLAEARGYRAMVEPGNGLTLPLVPNPQSRIDFLKQSVGKELIEQLAAFRAQKAAKAAADKSQVETDEAAKNVTVK